MSRAARIRESSRASSWKDLLSFRWRDSRRAYLKRGYGITAISRYVVATELETGSLSAVQVRGWNVRNVVSVLRVRDATLTPSADRFQMFVRERLPEMARHRTR
jgi:hypothetical protein